MDTHTLFWLCGPRLEQTHLYGPAVDLRSFVAVSYTRLQFYRMLRIVLYIYEGRPYSVASLPMIVQGVIERYFVFDPGGWRLEQCSGSAERPIFDAS